MGKSWCFGLFIASIALTSVGVAGSTIVYWFGKLQDQQELYSALMSVLSLYLIAVIAAAGLVQRMIQGIVEIYRVTSPTRNTASIDRSQVEKKD